MAIKKTQEQVEKEIKNMYDGEYELVSEYINTKTAITIKHSCGHSYTTRPKGFLNEGKGTCPKCREKVFISTKAVSYEIFCERFNKAYPDYTILDSNKRFQYDVANSLEIKHDVCGTILQIRPKDWLRAKKLSCKVCANVARTEHLRKQNFKENYLEEITKGTGYEFLEAYNGDNKEKLSIRHIECGTVYTVRPNDFQQGYRCPECSNSIYPSESRASKEITNFLEERDINFSKEFRDSRCKNINTLPFDFAIPIPDSNVTLLLEYDGSQHFEYGSGWNTLEKLQETQLRDKIKTDFCNNTDTYILKRINYKQNHLHELEKILEEFSL